MGLITYLKWGSSNKLAPEGSADRESPAAIGAAEQLRFYSLVRKFLVDLREIRSNPNLSETGQAQQADRLISAALKELEGAAIERIKVKLGKLESKVATELADRKRDIDQSQVREIREILRQKSSDERSRLLQAALESEDVEMLEVFFSARDFDPVVEDIDYIITDARTAWIQTVVGEEILQNVESAKHAVGATLFDKTELANDLRKLEGSELNQREFLADADTHKLPSATLAAS